MTNITGSAGAIQPLSKLHKEGEVRGEEEVWAWKTTLPAFNKMSHLLPTQQLRTDQRRHRTAGPRPLSNQTEDPSCKFHPDQERMLRTVPISQRQKVFLEEVTALAWFDTQQHLSTYHLQKGGGLIPTSLKACGPAGSALKRVVGRRAALSRSLGRFPGEGQESVRGQLRGRPVSTRAQRLIR